jgi:hypothetical protein
MKLRETLCNIIFPLLKGMNSYMISGNNALLRNIINLLVFYSII